LPSPNTNIVLALQQQNKQLAIQLEVQCQWNKHIIEKFDKLMEELKGEHLEASL
jgi:hypothetical protein